MKSSDKDTQILSQKIKHILLLNVSELHNNAETKSEDKHDNDHVNHKEISIMLITDELLLKDHFFFQTADFIDDSKFVFSHHDIHINNQFQLLHENMLCEIQDKLKILTKTKINHHKSIIMNDLSLAEVKMKTDHK